MLTSSEIPQTLNVSNNLLFYTPNPALGRAVNVGEDEEYLELENGCLCCSIRDAGVAAIAKMMRRKGKFDYIILETTGLADPCRLLAR